MVLPALIPVTFQAVSSNNYSRIIIVGGTLHNMPYTYTLSPAAIIAADFRASNFQSASSSRPASFIYVIVNGRRIKSLSTPQYNRNLAIRISRHDLESAYPATAAAPATGTNITGKPRYKVISPTQNGYYTEAVRELNERQIASMKQRGFKIDQVGGGFALQAAVRIPVLTHTTPQVSRRSRRGFVTGSYYNRGIATVAKNVIHRSERNPRLLFAESQRLFMVDMYAMKVTRNGVFVGLIQPIGIDQARKLRAYYKAKGPSYKTVLSRVSTTTNKITRTVTPDTSTQNPRTGTYAPKPIIGADSNLQRITQELKNLKAWIESINQRTSDQLIALGGATGDRQGQIDASNDRFEALNARISQQLIDLGNAASENSKAIAAQNAQRLLDDVKKTGGGGLGGITSFFTGEYSSYAILAVVAVVLLVMLKK